MTLEWEYILLWTSIPIFFGSFSFILYVLILQKRNLNIHKKYNIFHKNVYELNIKTIEKSLNRLEIISKKHNEYKKSYIEFSKKVNVLEKQIYELRKKIWKRVVPKTSLDRKKMMKIITQYSKIKTNLDKKKKQMELHILKLIQSDKYLDKESAFLKINFKKISSIYYGQQGLYSRLNPNINLIINEINKNFVAFGKNYKLADWYLCANQINEIRSRLWDLMQLVDKLPKIIYWIDYYIPKLMTEVKNNFMKLKKLTKSELVYFDFATNMKKVQSKFEKTKKTLLKLQIDKNFEAKLISLAKDLIKWKNIIAKEQKSFNYLKTNIDEIVKTFNNSKNSFNKSIDQFQTLLYSNKSAKFFFGSKEVEYKKWQKEKRLFDLKIDNFSRSKSNKDIPFNILIDKVNTIFLSIIDLEKNQKRIHKGVYAFVNRFNILQTEVKNMEIAIAKLSVMIKKQPTIAGEFNKKLLLMKKQLVYYAKQIEQRRFNKLDSLKININKIRESYLMLQEEIEKEFIVRKMYFCIKNKIDMQNNDKKLSNQKIKDLNLNQNEYNFKLINSVIRNVDWRFKKNVQ